MSLLCEPESLRHDQDRIDSTIEHGRPFSELVLLFPNSLEAQQYYAATMGRKFGRPLSRNCVCCGEPADRVEIYTWSAPINTKATLLRNILVTVVALCTHHFETNYPTVDFQTAHSFCRSCARSAAWKRAAAQALHYLFFTLLILSLFAAVPLVVFTVAMAFAAPELAVKVAPWLPLLVVPFGICVYAFAQIRRLKIPAALRPIGRRPFDFARAKSVAL